MTVRTLLLLLIALLAPATAAADTTVDGSGDTVFVEGDASANRITLTVEAEYVVISDAAGNVDDIDDNDDCEQDGSRVRCTTLGALEFMRVRGGDGDDRLTDDLPAEHTLTLVTLQGMGGGDTLDAGPRTDLLGGDGHDTLNARSEGLDEGDQGGAGDDVFNGGGLADLFVQEAGADSYSGGAGPDRISYASGPVSVIVDGLANDGQAGEKDNVSSTVEVIAGTAAGDVLSGGDDGHTLIGGDGDDALTSGNGDDVLDGGHGADRLTGGGGGDLLEAGAGEPDASPDRLDGGGGDDTFLPGRGPDEMIGGPGIDGVDFSRDGAPTQVSLDDQANDGPGDGDNVRSDVESVRTGSGNDVLVGSGGPDQLDAGPGDDRVDGRGGFDILTGGDGTDALFSRDLGFDVVNCGDGLDATVEGDAGDRLEGCEASSLSPLAPPADTTRSKLTLSGRTAISARAFAKARGITLTARTDEPTALLAQATVKGMLARAGDYVLGERALPAAGTAPRELKLRFARRDVRAIRRKLRRRAYRFTVRVTATDAAGNRTTAARRFTIRRRS